MFRRRLVPQLFRHRHREGGEHDRGSSDRGHAPPKLRGPVADSVRQLRKLLQEREPESKDSEPVSADGDEISDILLDEEWARIVQLERENRRLGTSAFA